MAEMRFQLIEETTRGDHFHLMPEDECAYLREYTSGAGWRGGETNQQISNLKKKRGQGGYQYKGGAIALCAREMFASLSVDWLRTGTLVPIPPSKVRGDPEHDARMLHVCRRISDAAGFAVEIRDLLRQTVSTAPFHEGDRMSVADLAQLYEIDTSVELPEPTEIALIDDVLTAGTHFKAAQAVLHTRYPAAKIFGLFWARRVFPNPFENLDDT